MRFTIRDVLWLTAVVAVALALHLGWSREVARMRAANAAQVAKIRGEVVAEREKAKTRMSAILSRQLDLMVKSKKLEAQVGRLREDLPSPKPISLNPD